MKTDVCPDHNLLHSHLLGDVHGEQADWLDQHLATCSVCLQVLREMNPGDDSTENLRDEVRQQEGRESRITAIIEHGRELQAQIETLATDETLAIDPLKQQTAAKTTENFGTEIEFLDAPQQPDEIGRLGDYRVLDVMGVGGMGVVFRAEDPKLKRQVALKAMKRDVARSTSAKERFMREAQATAAIEHDNIVSIYQVGEDRGIPFIAMRYLRGQSLQGLLTKQSRLAPAQAVAIGQQIAAGLAAAHQRGLIHRDIKPDNIWIEEETGRAKILDFGLARSHDADSNLTQLGTVLGTPRYMSPEQAKAEKVDHRSDLFSLGSVLYHMVSGEAPFQGGNLTATLIKVAQGEFDPIEQVCPGLHPGLTGLITSLLATNPGSRPQTAQHVADSLAQIAKQLDADQAEIETQRLAGTIKVTPIPARASVDSADDSSPASFRIVILCSAALVAVALACYGLWATGVVIRADPENAAAEVKETRDNVATTVQGVELDPMEAYVFRMTNEYRSKQGLPPLQLDAKLCGAARDHCGDMQRLDFFSHQSPLPGKTRFFHRAENFGTTAAAENIARGAEDGKTVLELWLNSPSHRRNILGDHRRVGIGRSGDMYS